MGIERVQSKPMFKLPDAILRVYQMSESETRAQRDCSLASLLGPLNLAGETMRNRTLLRKGWN